MAALLADGVLNIIHGTKDAVNFVCDHPDIRAVSFVGSNPVGHLVHKRSTANGKRCQANLGAKNHGVILPVRALRAPPALSSLLVPSSRVSCGSCATVDPR